MTTAPIRPIDSPALASILAELRAAPTRADSTREVPAGPDVCCSGDRRGYQWHQRTGTLPACQASAGAASAYMREYYDRTDRYAGRVERHRQAQKGGGQR